MDLNERYKSGRFLFGGKKVLADFCYLVSMNGRRRVQCSGDVVQEVGVSSFSAVCGRLCMVIRWEGVYVDYTRC